MRATWRGSFCALTLAASAAGCGGGTSGSSSPLQTRYTISVAVSGLAGAGLALRSGAGGDLSVAADGTYAFPGSVADGTAYSVLVLQQPTSPWQTCVVTGGTGSVAGANVTASVSCATNTYRLGGSAAGISGSGLVLHSSVGSGEDLAVAASGPFTFVRPAPSGASYAVTVHTPPAAQVCAVVNGTGTVTSSDVSNVSVTCSASSFSVGGTIQGLSASGLVLHSTVNGEDLSVAANAVRFTFAAAVPAGTTYAVTVKTQPGNLTCTVANGTGTVSSANVTDVSVTCSSVVQAWTAPRSWGGVWPDSPTMVQHAHFNASGIVVDKGPAFTMVGGAPPAPVAFGGFPAGTRWAAGPFMQEAVNYQAADAGALDLTGDMLVCAIVKPARNRPFDSYESPIIAKSVGDGRFTLPGAGWVLMQMHQSWCFHYEYKDASGASHQFMAPVPNLFADQDFERTLSPALPIPGVEPGGVWPFALRNDPTYAVVCGGRSGDDIVIAANAWDPDSSVSVFSLKFDQMDQTMPSPFGGPYSLDADPTAPATIGGYALTSTAYRALFPGAVDTDNVPGFKGHTYDGHVFETAVWSEPATKENVQAKMQAFLGLSGGTYLRNREAGLTDATGTMHVASRHAPRVDPAKGVLFGLQSWNRVSYWIDGNAAYPYPMIFAAGENLDLWSKNGGLGGAPTVVFDVNVPAPGDNLGLGQRVSLPAGASISIDLDQVVPAAPGAPVYFPRLQPTWDATGPIQGQLWLRPASSGTLRILKTAPAPGSGEACTVIGVAGTPCEWKDVVLGSGGVPTGQWSRVSLNGSFTADATLDTAGLTQNKGTLVLSNQGSSTIDFYAWGVQLTQLGGGGDLGSFDPAELMYDWSPSAAARGAEAPDQPIYPIDVLKLDPVSASTASTGFCLGVCATMPSGLPWSTPFAKPRTAAAWVSDPANPTTAVRLSVAGQDGSASAGMLCLAVTGGAAVCAPVPAAFDDGAEHQVQACMSAAGEIRIHADGAATPIGTGSAGMTAPELQGGVLLVGNGDTRPVAGLTPWHGWISRALVCRNTGNPADCR